MIIVHIWKLRHGITQKKAVENILTCASESKFSTYYRSRAVEFVQEIVSHADHCASSANTKLMGMTMTIKDNISPDELLEFGQCFNYTSAPNKPSEQLKLFKVIITKFESGWPDAKENQLLILARDEVKALDVATNKYHNGEHESFSISEIEKPFSDGQILTDSGFYFLNHSTTGS